MRVILRTVATAATTLLALALWAVPAQADITPPQPFYADSTNASFDTCPHGITSGTLQWNTPGPAAPISVAISGKVVDRPAPDGTTPSCTPDDYSSSAIFTVYSGSAVVGSKTVTVDNGVVQFQFTLGSSTATTLTKLTVQVCRNPVHTLPPSYCGKIVTYVG
jgi:hypothetical protein